MPSDSSILSAADSPSDSDRPAPASSTAVPPVSRLLELAVEALGGSSRDGQRTMAAAVEHSIDTGEHLAVQAGTGTGKSVGYLVPGLRHAVTTGRTVIVSTATIALQRQLVDRDLPRLAEALKGPLGRTPRFALLKGRGNYLCLNKLHATTEAPPTAEEVMFDAFEISRMGRQIKRLSDWANDTETGDRDELVPGVEERAWRQVSVGARECVGKARCPFGDDCFAEKARVKAGHADVVVTNHAMLAIDAISGVAVLPPDPDVVIVDEAHELVDRVTDTATAELSATALSGATRRAASLVDDEVADRLKASVEDVTRLLEELPPGPWDRLPNGADTALAALGDACAATRVAIGPARQGTPLDAAAARTAALAAVDEVASTVTRILGTYDEPNPSQRRTVVWLAEERGSGGTTRHLLRAAPLSVAGLLRSTLFAESTVILTSATLTIGGNVNAFAAAWGLPAAGEGAADPAPTDAPPVPGPSTPGPSAPGPHTTGPDPALASGRSAAATGTTRWTSLDVGSPFDHPRSGILYVAAHLPPPKQGDAPAAVIDEIAELITAAGGRTLGLFSSMRAARYAADQLGARLTTPVLCQGDDTLSALVARFAEDEATSLFGTLSLWQGVDVPGRSSSLVIIDRIPFPRPDNPLLNARQRAVEARGGNGFLSIAANHAGLLLAQGAGRLLRSTADKGVVAVLDSRLVNARYGGYLRASLPPFWPTTDAAKVRAALRRLAAESD